MKKPVKINRFHWSTPVNKSFAYIYYNEGIENPVDLKKKILVFFKECGQFTEEEIDLAHRTNKYYYQRNKIAGKTTPKQYALDLLHKLQQNRKKQLEEHYERSEESIQ